MVASALTSVRAQGTLEFYAYLNGANEVPPSSSPYYGSGMFTLDGNVFNYSVGMSDVGTNGPFFYPTSAGIYGPATPNQNGSLIFDLGNYIPQPSHRLMGFSTKKALASVRLRATRHGHEKEKPKTKANEG